MNRHVLGLVLPILIGAGIIAMYAAHGADSNEQETAKATALEDIEERLARLEGTIDRIWYASLFDPCLVSINGDEFSIVCSVSPPLADPQVALRCLDSFGISMEFSRAPDGSGHLFVLKDAHNWKATHLVAGVNDIRFCMIYGAQRERFLTDRE